MSRHTLDRIANRLSSLPSIALPTDYPRPSHSSSLKVVEASIDADLNHRASLALARLALHEDDNLDTSSENERPSPPSPFHILLATFLALLHRYTGETDIVVATSSPSADHPDPLLLRAQVSPERSFWALVRTIERLEKEAEADHVPFETLLETVGQRENNQLDSPYAPLFRVRFLDAMDHTESQFLHSTSLTTDLTIMVKSPVPLTALKSSHEPMFPRPVSLTFLYNSLLFTSTRIHLMIEQLSMLLIQASMRPSAKLAVIPFLTPAQLSLLPDPRQDLNWTVWPGPITRIFSSNAHRHPSKLCVSERLIKDQGSDLIHPPTNHMRTFTYQQIDQASNILAHYLLAKGIEAEEVVTIYSTRGVDLVVAILGILKAGATFSVIDPAYPNQRQKIYLQVSRPRGLIVLAHAGKLSSEVQNFIDEEMSIKVTIPALSIQDDGHLLGGAEPGSSAQDVLMLTQCKSSVSPDIQLGPDSIGTLSFTSGSTGIPKGVKGRHFSLTHFFPWMADEFKLGEHSKFTMLSGIAHDPIQRDIFTPLFLGAELHIPTAEDIGTPGRLAEWMDDSRITVTHLTPAMGQLLSARATRQIPTLQNAFFVGDILTKRDCTRLQQLASNVTIINMFGTTETQRAVSFCRVPPISLDPIYLDTKKDIIPAGRGMKDVQLLVVNRVEKNLQCGIGELGEIYVRSSGLAEGYLGQPEVSAEKFLPNWFTAGALENKNDPLIEGKWLGARDRVYKTGDLGRYLPDGTVECVGRLDDQVKIRGFRIELGEIDTHLSQHPAIRENVTLVRRDKDEEKILVSYFVPMERDELQGLVSASEVEDEEEDVSELEKGIRKYRKLIKHIREYLKTKLPSYSIPTLFVPLVRMPLNPNGKIDKPALPFPDTARQVTSSHFDPTKASTSPPKGLTPTQSAIQSIWQSLLPNNLYSSTVIPIDESFFDLGGHSILATRLVFEIRRLMAVNAPLGLVFEYPTIGGLAHQIDILKIADFGLAKHDEEKMGVNQTAKSDSTAFDYAADERALKKTLKPTFPKPQSPDTATPQTVLLTGATGFLGTFILRALLSRPMHIGKVLCHLRAQSKEVGLVRLRQACESRGFWDDTWVADGRVEVVLGDLESRQIGLSDSLWVELSKRVDVIVHNGALVHWVYPYSKLRSANVIATLALLEFVGMGKPKTLTFISTTSVLEKAHYVDMSDILVQRGGRGVLETDDLEASATGLSTGYGQTKWVSERLIMEAGRRGLCGSIIRPAYVVGDSRTGVTNTDDFLWRLVKGCVQIGAIPDIHNTVNMLPVDGVAKCAMLASVRQAKDLKVFHLTAQPLPRMNSFLATLAAYGYKVVKEDYLDWRIKLEQSVIGRGPEDNALFPLLHFVLNDLPSSTKSAELDYSNTINLLEANDEVEVEMTVNAQQVGIYLAWLVKVGFLPPPEADHKLELPQIGYNAGWAVGRSGH